MSEFRLLRGARILQQLDEDSTVNRLRGNIQSAFPNTRKRQHATNEVTIDKVEYIPYLGTKFLHVRSTANGQYRQALQFVRVTFDKQDTPENITFVATDGQDYHVQPISLAAHNVKVRCNCLDFHFRFATWNFSDNSIVGPAPKPYRRVTNTRPPANPDHVPGLCKHLLKLIDELRQAQIVR